MEITHMNKSAKLATLSLLLGAALSSQASADSWGFSWSNRGSHVSYQQSHYSGYQPSYYHTNAHYARPVVYAPVVQQPTYYAVPQTRYHVQPVTEQVVSYRHVKRKVTYVEAVPTYRNRVVGYQYQPYQSYDYQRSYYNH
jgi:hypothetical protein